MIPSHPCTAWCDGARHVDLAYWVDDEWTHDEVSRITVDDYGREGVHVRVLRIELAREAPAASGHQQGEPHLIWWELA